VNVCLTEVEVGKPVILDVAEVDNLMALSGLVEAVLGSDHRGRWLLGASAFSEFENFALCILSC
jgi:hypothetical protein